MVKSFRSIQQFSPNLDIALYHERYPNINSHDAYAFPLEQIAAHLDTPNGLTKHRSI